MGVPGDAGTDTPAGGAGRLLVDEPAPAVTRLTISNPGRRGALDHAILDALASTLPGLEARCLVITGEADTFSAGYDLGALPDEPLPEEAERLVANPFAAAIDAVDSYRYPTLAVLNGPAIGGGLELALSCDLRLAASSVYVRMPPARLGLVYSHTGIQRFIDTVGAARTRELFLLARRVDARTAAAWGLVNEVAEDGRLVEEALRLASEIAAGAPLAQRGNKRVIRELLAARGALDPEVERELLELRRACFSSEDFREAVRAFAEKREPRWRGR
jgi:enoyl-CoA hydratase/carnithine racemase